MDEELYKRLKCFYKSGLELVKNWEFTFDTTTSQTSPVKELLLSDEEKREFFKQYHDELTEKRIKKIKRVKKIK